MKTIPQDPTLRIRHILHPTDFSPCAVSAWGYALRLARRFGAELHLLHVTPPPPKKSDRTLRDAAVARMQALLRETQRPEDRIQQVYAQGDSPAEEILAYAEDKDIDLLVMGTQGRRVVRGMLLGSVAQEVVRYAECPVLVVPLPEPAESDAPREETLLVPYDFSEYARYALTYAKELASLFQYQLDVLHVIDPVRLSDVLRHDTHAINMDEVQLEEVVHAHLKHVVHLQVDDQVPASTHLAFGYPPLEIAEYAQMHRVGMIVMASHGQYLTRKSNRFHMPLGSVTERVVRGATCPIFVAKPLGKSLLVPKAASVEQDVPV